MKFPGRKPYRRGTFGVSQITKWSRVGVNRDLSPGTDKTRRPGAPSKAPQRRANRWGASEKLADFGDQLAQGVAHVGHQLVVLARMLPVQRPERHRQLDRLHDTRAGDPEGLAGLIVCPYTTVLAVRSADHGQRLALERAVAERPGEPVDRVLDHRRNAAVVFRGHDQSCIG